MKVHILGICGTFMAGLAILAKELGYEVSGQDANVYPPMSTQLENYGIQLIEGFDPNDIPPGVDAIIVGNAMRRGNSVVEYLLDRNIPYQSGPQWLHDHVLQKRFVIAVAGTHGKTTTSSMVAYILDYAGMDPGFLIGGVPQNFGLSARIGQAPFFVIEADEYDTAFFDKRSKFIHYNPRTLILNNLEFDHADIFADLNAIQTQFHHLIRIVPGSGLIVMPDNDSNLQEVIKKGHWTPVQTFSTHSTSNADLTVRLNKSDGSEFEVYQGSHSLGKISWKLVGDHNIHNALAALLAAQHAGVPIHIGIEALTKFKNVKRRLEVCGSVNQITVYDDFAHHPTAIATTLAGLRAKVGHARILAVVDFASNTMRMGSHQECVGASVEIADKVIFAKPTDLTWDIVKVANQMKTPAIILEKIDEIISTLTAMAEPGDHILIMSNKGFGGIHPKLLAALTERFYSKVEL